MLATIAGQIISLAVGPVARLRTRAFYVIHRHSSWHDSLCLRPDVHEELLFWQTQTPFLKGQPIRFGTGITRVAFFDASSMGYGGNVLELGPHVVHGEWSESEASQSSTWKAVYQVLCSYARQFGGHAIKWFTDNQNVVRVVQVGVGSHISRMEL